MLLLALSAAAFIGGAAYVMSRGAPDKRVVQTREGGQRGHDALFGGIAPRPYDSAARVRDGGWFIGAGDRHAELAESSEDVSLLAIQHPEEPLYAHLDRWSLGVTENYKLMKATYQCELAHLTELEATCNFRLRMVVEPTEDGQGRVTYAKATSEAPMDDKCRAYSDCLANSVYLGETTPYAQDRDTPMALHMDGKMLPSVATRAEYVRHMEESLAGVTKEYEQMLGDPDSLPHNLERMEALIQFHKIRVDYQSREFP